MTHVLKIEQEIQETEEKLEELRQRLSEEQEHGAHGSIGSLKELLHPNDGGLTDFEIYTNIVDAIKRAAEIDMERAKNLPTSKGKDLAFITLLRNYGEIARDLMWENISFNCDLEYRRRFKL